MSSSQRRKTLSQDDHAAWAAYARLVVPLPGHAMPEALVLEATSVPAPEVGATPPPAPKGKTAHSPLLVGAHPGGLDRASWNRFRAGKLAAARTLDLHGRTAQNAFHALNAFLHAAHADGVRCVEVITGRGSGEGSGVIRRELPHWLNLPALRPLVLAASHPHAANPGAVRLLLRRAK